MHKPYRKYFTAMTIKKNPKTPKQNQKNPTHFNHDAKKAAVTDH